MKSATPFRSGISNPRRSKKGTTCCLGPWKTIRPAMDMNRAGTKLLDQLCFQALEEAPALKVAKGAQLLEMFVAKWR